MTEYSQTTFTLNHLTCTQGEHANKTVDAAQFDALGPGYLLGPHKEFRLVKELGKGGMGVTWLAEELDSDGSKKQSVVCKILSRELINDENAVRNVLAVFDLTKELNHTHICPLLNRFQDPVFRHFLVMRYAEGETLEEWFQRQPGHENGLPAQTVLPILQQVASALDSMHVRNIIHRDVKPQNIMFSTRNTALAVPWLIDFGIAQAVNASDPEKNRSKSGTPVFMAPEQHYGKPQTARTDQYALAVTAFRLLTGRFPFTAETPEELSAKKMFPEASLPEIAPALRSTFLRALAYEPKDRFSSCAEFVNALQSTLFPASASNTPVKEQSLDELAQEFYEKLLQEDQTKRLREEAARLAREQREREEAEKRRKEEEARRFHEEAERIARERFEREKAARFNVRGQSAGLRMVKTVDGIEYAFRWCPPGTFMMGSPSSELGRNDDEGQHAVTLAKGFWMLETPVTQGMWQSVMGKNPSCFKGWIFSKDKNPVEQVSWEECDVFCRKLSSKLGLKVSFPTEAQWEYACRAGSTGEYAGYLDEVSWYGRNSDAETHPVGRKKPNAWGLYDMHGNVWEWCSDWYGPYPTSPTSDPTGSNSGSRRVKRGGGWNNYERCGRSAFRSGATPDTWSGDLGFRIVLAESDK